MIDLRYTKRGTAYVWASEIHGELGYRGAVDVWFLPITRKGEFIANEHYWGFERPDQEQNVVVKDWSVRLDMAKYLLATMETDRSRSLMRYLIYLEERRSEGEYLSHKQIEALMDLVEVLGLFSVQEFLEREHSIEFLKNYKNNQWWEYRANIFGITVDDIREIIATYGIEYKSVRQALFYIDRYELIRRAAVDLFKAMGKTHEYALNMGNMAKLFAERSKAEVYNDLGFTLNFNTEKQNATIAQIQAYKQGTIMLRPFQI